jgi:hypothetical protein
MQLDVRWAGWAGDSLEHLSLRPAANGVEAESVIIGPGFAARYRLAIDAAWRTREVEVAVLGEGRLDLRSDGEGSWWDASGAVLSELTGAIDPDLSASPFTNTLPIRRLQLAPSESRDILTAYVSFPDLTLQADPQRYTCLEAGRLYRYASRDSDFQRDLEVDAEGLVLTYPGLYRRLPLA